MGEHEELETSTQELEKIKQAIDKTYQEEERLYTDAKRLYTDALGYIEQAIKAKLSDSANELEGLTKDSKVLQKATKLYDKNKLDILKSDVEELKKFDITKDYIDEFNEWLQTAEIKTINPDDDKPIKEQIETNITAKLTEIDTQIKQLQKLEDLEKKIEAKLTEIEIIEKASTKLSAIVQHDLPDEDKYNEIHSYLKEEAPDIVTKTAEELENNIKVFNEKLKSLEQEKNSLEQNINRIVEILDNQKQQFEQQGSNSQKQNSNLDALKRKEFIAESMKPEVQEKHGMELKFVDNSINDRSGVEVQQIKADYEEQLSNLHKKIEQIAQRHKEDLKQISKSYEYKADLLNQTVDKLTNDLKLNQDNLAKQIGETLKIKEEKQELEKRLENLKDELEEAQAPRGESLASELAGFDIEQPERQAQQEQQQEQQIEELRKQLDEALEEKAQIKSDLNSAHYKYEEIQEKHQREIQRLTQESEEIKQQAEKNATEVGAQAAQASQKLEQTLNALEENNLKMKELSEAQAQLTNEKQELAKEREVNKSQIEQLQKEQDQSKQNLKTVENKLSTVSEENLNLKSQLETNAQELQTVKHQSEIKIKEVERAAADATKDAERAKKDLDNSEKIAREKSEEAGKLSAKLNQQDNLLKQQANELTSVKSTLIAKEQQAKRLESEKFKIQNQLSNSITDIAAKIQENKKISNELEETKVQKTLILQKATEWEGENLSLQQQIEANRAGMQERDKDIARIKNENYGLTKANKELEKELENTKRNFVQKNTEYQSELAAKDKEIANLKAELEKMLNLQKDVAKQEYTQEQGLGQGQGQVQAQEQLDNQSRSLENQKNYTEGSPSLVAEQPIITDKANISPSDEILKAFRELRKIQRDVIAGAISGIPSKKEAFHHYAYTNGEEIAKKLPKETAKFIAEIESQTYQAIHNKYKHAPIKWNDGKASITKQDGTKLCELVNKAAGNSKSYSLEGEKVEKYRSLDLPNNIGTGPLHMSFAVKDLQGQNISSKEAVYFSAHYDKQGKLVEVIAPVPVLFTDKGKDSPICIKQNGKTYTLPINRGKYEKMLETVALNKALDKSVVHQQNIKQEKVKAMRANLNNRANLSNSTKLKYEAKARSNSMHSGRNQKSGHFL